MTDALLLVPESLEPLLSPDSYHRERTTVFLDKVLFDKVKTQLFERTSVSSSYSRDRVPRINLSLLVLDCL